jgi:hypothetical protein
MIVNRGGRRMQAHTMVGASIDLRGRKPLPSVVPWPSTYTSLDSVYWKMGVLVFDGTPILSLIQILKHPRFRLGPRQVLFSGCVSFNNSGGRNYCRNSLVCIYVWKILNTLFYIVIRKIHRFGALAEENRKTTKWGTGGVWSGVVQRLLIRQKRAKRWRNGRTVRRKVVRGSVG